MAANLETGVEPRPTGSRLDLIQATVTAIAQHGLSNLTSAKIAGIAGHTAASVNFHFGGKEALLLATLREVSEEFAEVMATVQAESGGDDLQWLLGIVDASLGRRLSESRKVAVWYAFLAESNARKDYQSICGDRDEAFVRTVTTLCRRLIAARGDRRLARCRCGRARPDRAHRPALAGHPVRGRRLRPRGCPAPVPRLPVQRVPLARAAHRGRGAREGEGARDGAGCGRRSGAAVHAPGLGLSQRGIPRARARTPVRALVAGRLPRERGAAGRRLRDFRILRPPWLRRAGRRGDAPRLPQRLRAPRARGRLGRARPLRQVPDLHVPRLDLSPRRAQPQRQRARHLPEVRPLEIRPEADRARSVHGHGVRALPRGRAVGRRAHGAACGGTRALQDGPDGAARRALDPRARDRLEERGRELRRGLPLPDRPSGPVGADGGEVRPRDLPRRHDAALAPHARKAAQVLERGALCEVPAGDRAPARGHAPPLDLLRTVSERVLRHLPGVARLFPSCCRSAPAAR